MRKYLIFLIILLFTASLSFTSFSKNLKIGYVDMLELFNEYQKTKDFDDNLEKKRLEAEEKLNEKKEDIEKIQNKLSLLKEEEKEKETENIKQKIAAYRELEREAYVEIKKERDEKMKEIIDNLDGVIQKYSKKNNFDLIVNKNAVLYGNRAMDITAAIIKISNQEYKKK